MWPMSNHAPNVPHNGRVEYVAFMDTTQKPWQFKTKSPRPVLGSMLYRTVIFRPHGYRFHQSRRPQRESVSSTHYTCKDRNTILYHASSSRHRHIGSIRIQITLLQLVLLFFATQVHREWNQNRQTPNIPCRPTYLRYHHSTRFWHTYRSRIKDARTHQHPNHTDQRKDSS